MFNINRLKKMGVVPTLLFFGIPGAVITWAFLVLYPSLKASEFPEYWNIFLCIWGPLLLLLSGVMLFWRKSGLSFRDYFMVSPLSKKQWLVVGAGVIVVQAIELATGPTRGMLAGLPGFKVPAVFPTMFRPDFMPEIPLKTFMGMEVAGNPLPLLLWGLWLIVNIGGEEILWRGFALPRMEKAFGKWAWLINGLLWNLSIHFLMRWTFISLLPVSLIVPYLSQRFKSWWPGVMIHGIGNLLYFIVLIPSVFAG